jgi:hypothetical protein
MIRCPYRDHIAVTTYPSRCVPADELAGGEYATKPTASACALCLKETADVTSVIASLAYSGLVATGQTEAAGRILQTHEDLFIGSPVSPCEHRGQLLARVKGDTLDCGCCGVDVHACGRNVEAIIRPLPPDAAEVLRHLRPDWTGAVCETCPILPRSTGVPQFSRVHVVNLARRLERWEAFLSRLPDPWPLPRPERVLAVDGSLCRPPSGWRGGRGAWGCYRSHLRIIEQSLADGAGPILLLEDDATFADGFADNLANFLKSLPTDWHMAYLGGQHHRRQAGRPQPVGGVFRVFNLNRTHAYAISKAGLPIVYRHLCTPFTQWQVPHHIDHWLGQLHERGHRDGSVNVYCPAEWLCHQAEGRSDVAEREKQNQMWRGSIAFADRPPPNQRPFIAILGLHSSGSSALAGVLYHLGVWFGDPSALGGAWGKDPDRNCGFEHRRLAKICERAWPFPRLEPARGGRFVQQKIRPWIQMRQAEAELRHTVAAGKYPLLGPWWTVLYKLCGPNLRIVFADRPPEESIASLQRRTGDLLSDRDLIRLHQNKLWMHLQNCAAQFPDAVHVSYGDLIGDPQSVASTLVERLGLHPTAEQFQKAVAYVKPEMAHAR